MSTHASRKNPMSQSLPNNEKISALIEKEDDPKDRAFLIVLQQINTSLIANTSTINEVASKLNEHLDNYDEHSRRDAELLNRGKGIWAIASWGLAAVQSIILGAAAMLWNDISAMRTTDLKLATSLVATENKLSILDARIIIVERQLSKKE